MLKGQKAIQDSFADLFATRKGLKVRIDVASLRFPAPDLAIEDGTSTVLAPDGSAPSRARYTNVLIKKDGKWLLSSVREAAYSEPTNYEHLKGLEWAIGEWGDEQPNGPVGRVSFEWAPGQNFIVATRGVEFKDNILDNGTEWIGWDPAAKSVHAEDTARCLQTYLDAFHAHRPFTMEYRMRRADGEYRWILDTGVPRFEADGGYGDSVWTKDGTKWVVKANSTLSDGSKVSATHIITAVDADTVTWQSKDQTVSGKPLPDTKQIKMKRVQ